MSKISEDRGDADEFELSIDDLSRWGSGVGRAPDGRVVFVPLTAPGDRVLVRLRKKDKRFAEGELIKILEPSKRRVVPPCSIFGRCGGCQWQHLPYELQWTTKAAGVRQSLSRLRLDIPDVVDEFPAEKAYGYRNRIQVRAHEGHLGFYGAKSHDLIVTDGCPVADPRINAAWERVRAEVPPTEGEHKAEIEVPLSGEARWVFDQPHAAMGFRQVNDDQNVKLQSWVLGALLDEGELFDLYGGSGNLSLGLASRMHRIDCVDTSSPLARPIGVPENFFFHQAPVAKWLTNRAKLSRRNKTPLPERPRMAVLDPPREGLGRDAEQIIRALEKLGVTRVVAVGCDPDAWARDLATFARFGWRFEKMAVLDFFPQTTHVESVMLLRR